MNSSVLVFLSYFGALLILTFPLWLNINRLFWGDFALSDTFGTIWVHWVVKESVLHFDFGSIWHTNLIFYPIGKMLLLDIGNVLTPALGIPFQLLFGFPASHSLMRITVVALDGLAMYLLIKYLLKNNRVAFLSGLIFAFSPYVINQINCGDIEQAVLFWMILYILYLFKLINEKSWKNVLFAGLFFSLTSLSYWFYGLLLVFFTAILILYHLCFYRRPLITPLFLKRFLGLTALSLLLTVPFGWPYLQGLYTCGLSWLVPFPALSQIQAGGLPAYVYSIMDFSQKLSSPFLFSTYFKNLFFLKAFVIVLPLFAPVRKKAFFWLLSAAFFYILSLGPYLQYSGSSEIPFIREGLPLPYHFFYKYIPFFSRFWWLDRLTTLEHISLTVIYGISFCLIFDFLKSNITKILLFLAIIYLSLAGGIFYGSELRIKLSNIYIPVFYQELQKEEGCAIIELPIDYTGQKNLFYQTIHRKRTLGGMGMTSSFMLLPRGFEKFMKNNSFIMFLYSLPDLNEARYANNDLEQLKNLGYKYLVVNREYFMDKPAGAWEKTNEALERIFGRPQVYPDDIMVYKLRVPPAG